VTSEPPETNRPLLYLFIDTSTWLDLAKRRTASGCSGRCTLCRGRPRRATGAPGDPDEFDRNREGVEKSMTTSLTERIKAFRKS
jgi:hypothetical protein